MRDRVTLQYSDWTFGNHETIGKESIDIHFHPLLKRQKKKKKNRFSIAFSNITLMAALNQYSITPAHDTTFLQQILGQEARAIS